MQIIIEIVGLIILAWFLGGIIDTITDILPNGRKLTWPDCPKCNRKRRIWEIVFPIKCKNCQFSPTARKWFIFISFPCLLIAAWYLLPSKVPYLLTTALFAYVYIVGIIDFEHGDIYYSTIWIGIILLLAVGYFRNGLVYSLVGGVSGFLIVYLLYVMGKWFAKLYIKLRDIEIPDTPLAFGDVLVSGVLGLCLGWPDIAGSLFLGIIIGGLTSLGIILMNSIKKSYKPFMAVPYAPFLLIGAVIIYFRF